MTETLQWPPPHLSVVPRAPQVSLAGYITSAFTLGQTISSYAMGWAADRFGRVPVLVVSMLNIAAFGVAFGMSTSLTMAITTR